MVKSSFQVLNYFLVVQTLMKHQNIMTKINNSASEDWIVINTIVKQSIKISDCA